MNIKKWVLVYLHPPKPIIRLYHVFFPHTHQHNVKPPTWQESQEKYVHWTREKLPEDYRQVVRKIANQFKDWSNIDPLHIILDVGCGSDMIGGTTYQRFFGFDDKYLYSYWHGIDPLAGRATEIGFAEKMPYTSNWFDRVQIATSIDHFADWKVALKECLRVVNASGEINIWFTDTAESDAYHPNRLQFIDLARWLQGEKVSWRFYDEPWRENPNVRTVFMKIKKLN